MACILTGYTPFHFIKFQAGGQTYNRPGPAILALPGGIRQIFSFNRNSVSFLTAMPRWLILFFIGGGI